MWLSYSKDGEVEVSIEQFLRCAISEFPEEISKTAQRPASAHLFEVQYESDRVLFDDNRS